jgi:Nickel responsive protein SCO4226-like
MPRYLVERTLPDGLTILMDHSGRRACAAVVDNNTAHGVTWVHSYVTPGDGSMFCVYDAPTPESIRTAAEANGLPVDSIVEVNVLDPYFYHPEGSATRPT